jgi:hypothetical protein
MYPAVHPVSAYVSYACSEAAQTQQAVVLSLSRTTFGAALLVGYYLWSCITSVMTVYSYNGVRCAFLGGMCAGLAIRVYVAPALLATPSSSLNSLDKCCRCARVCGNGVVCFAEGSGSAARAGQVTPRPHGVWMTVVLAVQESLKSRLLCMSHMHAGSGCGRFTATC